MLAGFCAQGSDESFELIVVDNNSFEEDIDALYSPYVDKLPSCVMSAGSACAGRALASPALGVMPSVSPAIGRGGNDRFVLRAYGLDVLVTLRTE